MSPSISDYPGAQAGPRDRAVSGDRTGGPAAGDRCPCLTAGLILLAVAALVPIGRADPVRAGLRFPPSDAAGPGQDEADQADEVETVDSDACADCHEADADGHPFSESLARSAHQDLECLSCHADRETVPHEAESTFRAGCEGCRNCHDDIDAEYVAHGRGTVGRYAEMPQCNDCHGSHDILPSTDKASHTHPANLPATCGHCHEDLDLVRKYEIPVEKPVELYQTSVHGRATRGGIYVAATCVDCHSEAGSSHKIYSPSNPESSINHFTIPRTCGKCHHSIEADFEEGIHGKLVNRGETDAPVCTTCHGEHGIISPSNPLSPVSRSRLAEETCARCHESTQLNEKYGVAPGRLPSFIDSYHGLKSKAGDTHVANCASCHGVHRILPSTDPSSTINPANLQRTCGQCHPKISSELASTPIHGVGGRGLRTPIADLIEQVYIYAIIVIIGSMVLHWLLDFARQLLILMRRRPQVRRMMPDEVMQHALLAISFIVLVISGFSLRFSEGGFARFFFGWDSGFVLRGVIHRTAAVAFMITVVWHVFYLVALRRGKRFFRDMLPRVDDLRELVQHVLYNLGRRPRPHCTSRFNYVEKAEYWALVWGTGVMLATGLLLWFDDWFVQYVPKGVLDVALVVHYWEAWLASLAILIWHLYSVVFSPHVYPMNPSWVTGMMPEAMYRHEHPGHLEKAQRETRLYIKRQIERMEVIEADREQEEREAAAEERGEREIEDRDSDRSAPPVPGAR